MYVMFFFCDCNERHIIYVLSFVDILQTAVLISRLLVNLSLITLAITMPGSG